MMIAPPLKLNEYEKVFIEFKIKAIETYDVTKKTIQFLSDEYFQKNRLKASELIHFNKQILAKMNKAEKMIREKYPNYTTGITFDLNDKSGSEDIFIKPNLQVIWIFLTSEENEARKQINQYLTKENQVRITYNMALTYFISIFEAFTKNFLKLILINNKQIMKGLKSEKKMNEIIKNTIDLESIEDLHDYFASMEVERYGYESIAKMAESIKGTFDVDIKKYDKWKNILILDRIRNLIVHADGIIDKSFIKDFSEEYGKLGQKVIISLKIFEESFQTIVGYIEFLKIKFFEKNNISSSIAIITDEEFNKLIQTKQNEKIDVATGNIFD